MKQSLSIVVPAFNEQSQLRDCLVAIASQTEPPEEVIVVDNNSSDATAAVANSFDFVTVVREPRQGLRYARNTGVDLASGNIIGRIDADTRLTPEWAASARRLFASASSLAAASGPCYYHDMPCKNLSLAGDNFCRENLFKLTGSPLLYGSNMVFRREAWLAVRARLCKTGEFFEDMDLTIHLRELGLKIAYDRSLAVGVSARRMDDSPRDFLANCRFYGATFARHDLFSWSAIGAKYIFLTIYPLAKIIRRIYDPASGKLLLAANRAKLKPRPTSNT
jgi:glycosyltransferase involved in cell wall biosynthesis